MNPETNKAVLITGASSGIGKSCALELDRLGYQVLAGVRNPEDGKALTEIASERLTFLIIDICDRTNISSAVNTVAQLVGDRGLYGLVNNAGIAIGAPLEFIPIPELRQQLEVNVIGQVAITQALLPQIRQAKGRVVNIGSISGRIAFPFMSAYCASKFALAALTDGLRMELKPWGIKVVLIEPGTIQTPIWEKSIKFADSLISKMPQPLYSQLYGTATENMRNAVLKEGSIIAKPEEVAAAVAIALTAKKPKTRYLVGDKIYLKAIFALMPDRLRNWMILKEIGIN
ncbi:MAG: SDR family oxidoreductase [Oscillatoria sp. SIO1A7]|nr:SDR family oxidoreductase [Oscillatoria sp. SIO1A7]